MPRKCLTGQTEQTSERMESWMKTQTDTPYSIGPLQLLRGPATWVKVFLFLTSFHFNRFRDEELNATKPSEIEYLSLGMEKLMQSKLLSRHRRQKALRTPKNVSLVSYCWLSTVIFADRCSKLSFQDLLHDFTEKFSEHCQISAMGCSAKNKLADG